MGSGGAVARERFCGAVAFPPRLREQVCGRRHGGGICEEKYSLATRQICRGCGETFETPSARRNGEHAHTRKTKTRAVNVLCPGRFVSEQLARKGAGREFGALHRHRAAVGFQKVERAIDASGSVVGFERKNLVGNHAEISAAGQTHAPMKRLALSARRGGNRERIVSEQADIAARAASFFKGEHHFRDEECVLQKDPLDGAIANAPIEAMRRDAFPAAEKGDASIAKATDHIARTAALEVVELTAGTLQVAVMVERLQPPQKLLTAAGHDACDLIRAKKAMAKNSAKDFFIARHEPHRRQFFGAAKARSPGERHALILP